jgi:hypothetical protein
MKKILFTMMCAALLASCASKRAAMVDFTITEAKTLQTLANARGVETALADSLIAAAERQNKERQTEDAFLLADEALLQLHLILLKQEQAVLNAENKSASDSLTAAMQYYDVFKGLLNELKKTPRGH